MDYLESIDSVHLQDKSRRQKFTTCFVYGCFSTSASRTQLGFHKFPKQGNRNVIVTKKNGDKCLYDRRQLWIEALNIGRGASFVLDRVNVCVCSLHFARADFYYNQDLTGKKYLKEFAIPRRNLPPRNNSPLTTKFIVRPLNRRKYRGYTNIHNPDGRKLTAPRLFLGAKKNNEVHINPTYTKTVWVERKPLADQQGVSEEEHRSIVTVARTFSLHKHPQKDDNNEGEIEKEQCTILEDNTSQSSNPWFTSELIIKEEPISDCEQVSMGSNVDEEDFYHEPDNLVIQSDDEELPSQVIESQVDQQDAVEDLFETEEDYLEDAEDTASTEASEYEGQDVKEPEISIHEGYEDIPEQDYNYHNDEAAENNYSDMTVVHVGDNDEYQYNISCNVCGVENCETHAFPSVKENYFVCLICSDIFPSQKHLALHSKIHSEMSEEEVLLCEERTKSLTCEFCGRVLSTKATLREHIMIHTGEKPHQCLLCGKSFRHKANLVVHVNGHAVVSTYKCKKCNKAFTKKIDFEKHLHVHVDKSGNPLVCKICNSVFKSQRTLYNHSQLHSLNGSVRMKKRNCKAKNPQFVCKICGRGLSTKNTLKEHMMIHSGEKPHECKICGRTIRHKANFIVHVQTHGQGKSFECDMCDEAFMRKSDLTQHKQLEHSKSKLLRCPICSEVFKSPQKFNRHMEIHESVVYMNETEELNEFEPHLLESYIE